MSTLVLELLHCFPITLKFSPSSSTSPPTVAWPFTPATSFANACRDKGTAVDPQQACFAAVSGIDIPVMVPKHEEIPYGEKKTGVWSRTSDWELKRAPSGKSPP